VERGCEVKWKGVANLDAFFPQIIVRGPCVAGMEAALGVAGKMREDNTLAYV
jgi:hypothetical protein